MTTAAAASDNAIMQWVVNVTARAGLLRVANIAARTAVLAFVGLITFTSSWPAHTPHRGAQVTLQVVAFTVSAVLMAAWAAVDFLPKLRPRCVPWILGTIALVSGAAAATKTGGNFSGLALIAAISAGSADSLVVGWVVAGLGVLGFESLALPWGTDIWGLIGYPGTLLAGLLLGLNRRDHRLRAEQSAVLLSKADQLREERTRRRKRPWSDEASTALVTRLERTWRISPG